MNEHDYEKRIQHVRDAHEIQGRDGNWNYSEYMFGIYNALEFAMTMLENRDVNYKNQPEEWLCDKTDIGSPTIAEEQGDGIDYRVSF